MGHEHDEFADFYRASRDSCLKAVTAVVGDRQLAEEQVAEAFARPDPEGAVELTAEPGDALFFDRRIWHARSRTYSGHTGKAVFLGYTYRWTAIRDDAAATAASGWLGELTPVQQQLLGGIEGGNGDHAWGHDPAATPLYGWLKERRLLDPANPPLKP